jgi:hypothetical protein
MDFIALRFDYTFIDQADDPVSMDAASLTQLAQSQAVIFNNGTGMHRH